MADAKKKKLKLVVVSCPQCGNKLFCKLGGVEAVVFCSETCGGRCNDRENFDIEKNVIGGRCTQCQAEEFFC